MALNNRQLLPLNTPRLASRYFYARERRKGLFDPAYNLFETHRFDASQNPIDTGARFPSSAVIRPITFHTEVKRTGAAPTGIILSFGSTPAGMAMWMEGADVGIAAGSGGTNGVAATAQNLLVATDQTVRLTFVSIPGIGIIALFANHTLVTYAQAVDETFPSGWASDTAGAIAEAPAAVNDRIPAPRRVNLADAALVRPVRAFVGQYPQQLDARLPSTGSPPIPLVPPGGTGGSFGESFDTSFDGGST